MEFRELSLATNSSSEFESKPSRKRKFHASVDLQFKNPLPLDWEQCLDLESGRMYYLNRKTAKKARSWPKEQKLDLELNISCSDQSDKSIHPSSSNMVALACLNCHLLVMLSESSPSCPNCKHLHSLPFRPDPPPASIKSLSTLSLLN